MNLKDFDINWTKGITTEEWDKIRHDWYSSSYEVERLNNASKIINIIGTILMSAMTITPFIFGVIMNLA